MLIRNMDIKDAFVESSGENEHGSENWGNSILLM